MKWKGETPSMNLDRLSKPHKKFALFPTQMDSGEWVWLQTFTRRMVSWNGYVGPTWTYYLEE